MIVKRAFAKYAVLMCAVGLSVAIACKRDPAALAPPPTTTPGYDVIDLGTLGGSSARPYALNDSGDVVGWSTTASGESHAFVWRDGVFRDLTGPFAESRAETITNSGLVAGVAWRAGSEEPRIFQWSNGVTTDLGTVRPLGGQGEDAVLVLTTNDIVAWHRNSERYTSAIWHNGVRQLLDGLTPFWNPGGEARAIAMNNRGQIVGASLMPGAAVNDVYHAFMWKDGVTRDLGVLTEFACDYDPALNCGESGAVDINDNSQVIGWSFDESSHLRGVLWANSSITDLGSWSPAAINGAGEIAGHGLSGTDGAGYFWRSGTLTTIGSLPGGGTHVVDMNDQSAVVGTSLTADGKPHVFVWKPGQATLTDLGAGPPGSPGAGIGTVAVAINARGDILGYTCAVYEWGSCSLQNYRAILWRRKN